MIQLKNWPVKVLRYTSYFAPRWGTFHHGIDAGAEERGVVGDPLYATADGIVMRVRPMHPLMGNYVVMEHDKSWCDMDEHMNDFAVKVGQIIKAGDLIGHMGTTGRSTGAHLHYEIRDCPYARFYDKGTLQGFVNMPKYAIDPKPYLDAVKAPVKINNDKPVIPPKVDTSPLKRGDKVRVKVATAVGNVKYGKTTTGGLFRIYNSAYDVIGVNGDRVVIGVGNAVTAAVRTESLERIN